MGKKNSKLGQDTVDRLVKNTYCELFSLLLWLLTLCELLW
jgi:hypothetical protein